MRLERKQTELEDRPLPQSVREVKWFGGDQSASMFNQIRLIPSLRRAIKKIKPDLIHAGPLQSCAFMVALTGFQPLVSMSWGYDLLLDANRNIFWEKTTEFTLRRSSRLITDCLTLNQVAHQFRVPDAKIVTFPYGIDLDQFTPAEYPPGNGDQFTLLSTRSLESIYGVDILARAFVKAAHQNPRLNLIQLGTGSLAAELRSIFNRGGVMERVLLPGQQTQKDLPQFYNRADVYISTSHIDGSSVSLMEALACGRPVLVSDIPGNREWIEPGVQGWWFTDGDVDELARAILSAADQPHVLVKMSHEARKLAEKRANWDKNFPLLLEAYQAALGNGRNLNG